MSRPTWWRRRGGARQRLHLHVGLPKSGTSYLQQRLAEHRPQLAEAGFVYPFVRPEGMFHAAVELRAQHAVWGLAPETVDGTWAQLLRRVRTTGATGIVSHELLAGASAEVVERVRADTADLELHVVVTARDLGRQLTAHWQEEVKNGRPWSFAEFEASLGTAEESVEAELGFWRAQDLGDVVSRWRRAVAPQRLHVVVVPPPGAPPEELWRRFAGAVGLDPAALGPPAAGTGNPSLGVVQLHLLRRVVARLGDRLPPRERLVVVKRFFAQRVLAAGTSAAPVAPPELVRRLAPVAESWVAALREADHPVVGDPADLLPRPAGGRPRHPDDVTPEEVVDELPGILADLLAESVRRGGAGRLPAATTSRLAASRPAAAVVEEAAAVIAELLVELAAMRPSAPAPPPEVRE